MLSNWMVLLIKVTDARQRHYCFHFIGNKIVLKCLARIERELFVTVTAGLFRVFIYRETFQEEFQSITSQPWWVGSLPGSRSDRLLPKGKSTLLGIQCKIPTVTIFCFHALRSGLGALTGNFVSDQLAALHFAYAGEKRSDLFLRHGLWKVVYDQVGLGLFLPTALSSAAAILLANDAGIQTVRHHCDNILMKKITENSQGCSEHVAYRTIYTF